MCNRRSMGCVYYMWQLVFADIINNDKLLCIVTDRDHLTVRIYNYDRHIIVHMIRLYTRLVTYVRLHILTLVVGYQLYIVHSFVLYIDYSVIFHFSYHVVIACVVAVSYTHLTLPTIYSV